MTHTQTKAITSDSTPWRAVVIRGLPGIGKTSLANNVIETLNKRGYRAFQINADEVRASINADLGFSPQDRSENARRIGALTRLALQNRLIPVVDFVMPTKESYDNFVLGSGSNSSFVLWSLKTREGFQCRFPDTQVVFQPVSAEWTQELPDPNLINELDPYPSDRIQSTADFILTVQGYR